MSGLLGLITAVSIILDGHSKHLMSGDYQENNRITGFEIATTIEDPFSKKFLDIKNSKVSFYFKSFINSLDKHSQTIGGNIHWWEHDNSFGWKFKVGYSIGLVRGYPKAPIYQDRVNTINTEIAPYAMLWANFSMKLHPKLPIELGVDFNTTGLASGYQPKLTFEKNW